MNRHGAFFTLASIIFVGILIYSVTIDTNQYLRMRSMAASDRIRAVDFFITDFEQDMERGTYIAAFRAILGIQQYITSNGQFLKDPQGVFEEILLNGTINGTYISVMNQTELSVWIAKIQAEASKIAVTFDYAINDVRLYQTNPWVINVDLNMTLNVTDRKKTASWLKDMVVTSRVNITMFEDPLYTVNTYGRVLNTIEKTRYNFTDDDTSELLLHIDQSLYKESASGPSYVMRLSGNTSGSPYGIESLVNLKHLEDALLPIENKTCIDYLYFSNQTPAAYRINNTYNWFMIDNLSNHLFIYNVSDMII